MAQEQTAFLAACRLQLGHYGRPLDPAARRNGHLYRAAAVRLVHEPTGKRRIRTEPRSGTHRWRSAQRSAFQPELPRPGIQQSGYFPESAQGGRNTLRLKLRQSGREFQTPAIVAHERRRRFPPAVGDGADSRSDVLEGYQRRNAAKHQPARSGRQFHRRRRPSQMEFGQTEQGRQLDDGADQYEQRTPGFADGTADQAIFERSVRYDRLHLQQCERPHCQSGQCRPVGLEIQRLGGQPERSGSQLFGLLDAAPCKRLYLLFGRLGQEPPAFDLHALL